MNIAKTASMVIAVGTIGGGALALDEMHVSASDFDQYIEQQQLADEREYIRNLKRDIREVTEALSQRPDDPYLNNELANLIDELCEYRPNDRLCT